ncbi:MAG: type I-E CRISPR-associated protein Cse2/CasB [Gammaproteobacteria bacterium]|nr:type I-E CRISPR-associated protein Cse2/CasB [Gammaproteobacteria bacterium]
MNDRNDVGAICTNWWKTTFGNDDGASRMTRARLRRSTSPVEVLTVESVHDLNRHLRDAGHRPGPDQLALVSVVLAHVEEIGDRKLASTFGHRASRDAPRALSSLRFQGLVRITDRVQLITPLRRAMAIVRRTPIDITALATDLYHWNERAQNSWCFQYFGAGDAEPETNQTGDQDQ